MLALLPCTQGWRHSSNVKGQHRSQRSESKTSGFLKIWRLIRSSIVCVQRLSLPAQSQQQPGILFHSPSSPVTQLDLELFLFLRLRSVEAGGLRLCNQKHIQSSGAGLTLTRLSTGACRVFGSPCAYSAFPAAEPSVMNERSGA